MFSTDENEIAERTVQVGLFISLFSVFLYYYPDFDALMYNTLPNNGIYTGFTLYHPDRYGIIHLSSVVLAIMFVLSMLLTNKLTPYIKIAGEKVVAWWDENMVEEWEEEIEVDDEELGD